MSQAGNHHIHNDFFKRAPKKTLCGIKLEKVGPVPSYSIMDVGTSVGRPIDCFPCMKKACAIMYKIAADFSVVGDIEIPDAIAALTKLHKHIQRFHDKGR